MPFTPAAHPKPDPPSVLLILTDDQRWDELSGMPVVRRELVRHGITFSNAFVSNSLCCPSRSSILTGDYSHTTRLYRQIPPYGRFDWFDDRSTLATWLQGAGYTTGLFGKYIDGYQHAAVTGYVPPGWDRWAAFVHSAYYDYRLSLDGQIVEHGVRPRDYSTTVLTRQALSFIRSSSGPLFVEFAPSAPHAPATPPPGERHAFDRLAPWRPPSYDESDVSDKPAYVRGLPSLTASERADEDTFRRDQYATLTAVDRSVGELLDAMRSTGRLSNTLVIFTSDNGIEWGEHRWTKKEMPYEESIRVPFVVRYDPLIPAPRVDRHLVVNIDIAPTIAEITGAGRPADDGLSLVPLLRSQRAPWRRDFLLEHMEGTNPVPTYCGVRGEHAVYVRYATGEEELYDLRRDPYELSNEARDPRAAAILAAMRRRLDVLCDPTPPGFLPRTRALPIAATTLIAFADVVVVVAMRRRRSAAGEG